MNGIQCPICKVALRISLATSRKATKKKAFIMLVCPMDGRHFRGFISDQEYVGRFVDSSGVISTKDSKSNGEGRVRT